MNWSSNLPRGLAYVMLSRAERLEDIYITGRFNPEKIKCVPEALIEAQRLDEISLTNLSTDVGHRDQDLRLSFVNIRSLRKNFEYLQTDQNMLEHEMIFVTETWGDTYTYFNLEGYNCAFANQGRGKGVGVFFKKDASIQKCEQDLFQFIKLRKETITVFCIYISKGCDFKKVVESLKHYGFNNKACLLGDFNFDANNNNDLVDYMRSLNMSQIVKRATHLEGHILDQVYIPEEIVKSTSIKLQHNYYSDHDGISLSFKTSRFLNEESMDMTM